MSFIAFLPIVVVFFGTLTIGNQIHVLCYEIFHEIIGESNYVPKWDRLEAWLSHKL